MFTWLGGIAVDLREAQLAPDAHLELGSLFGGIALRVPPGWRVESDVRSLAGGVAIDVPEPEIRRRHRRSADAGSRRSAESRSAPSRRELERATRDPVPRLGAREGRSRRRRRARRHDPRDGRARPAEARPQVAVLRGDGEEPAAHHRRARRRSRARGGGRSPTSTSPRRRSSRCARRAGTSSSSGSILAFGFSPLWLLAGAADVTQGHARLPRRARRPS